MEGGEILPAHAVVGCIIEMTTADGARTRLTPKLDRLHPVNVELVATDPGVFDAVRTIGQFETRGQRLEVDIPGGYTIEQMPPAASFEVSGDARDLVRRALTVLIDVLDRQAQRDRNEMGSGEPMSTDAQQARELLFALGALTDPDE